MTFMDELAIPLDSMVDKVALVKGVASIHHFVRMVGNNRVKQNGKDFRACLDFINDLLDGHVLALLFSAADVETSAQFAKALEKDYNWPDMLDTLSGHIYGTKVSDWRQDAKGTELEVVKRDIPLENALLFLRNMLVFRDYEDAVKCGDTGRITKCIEY